MTGMVGNAAGWQALVAADDSEFWFALRRELPDLSERLRTVRSGRDCLRAIEDRRVRIVVLDSSLGDVSGPQLVHLVRRMRGDVGIVLTFAHSDQRQEREARQAGILYYGDREGLKEIAQVLRKGLEPAANGNGAEGKGCAARPGLAADGTGDATSDPPARTDVPGGPTAGAIEIDSSGRRAGPVESGGPPSDTGSRPEVRRSGLRSDAGGAGIRETATDRGYSTASRMVNGRYGDARAQLGAFNR